MAFASTGVSLAAELGYKWGAVVNDLELHDDIATVHRELEGGVEEITDVALPAVLTIQTGINEPRYASLRGIRQAQSKPLDVKTLEDVGVAAEDLPLSLTLSSLYEPETEGEAALFEGSAEETAGELADLLREKGVEA
jgi:electron transfer flavoprotein beta subunit